MRAELFYWDGLFEDNCKEERYRRYVVTPA